jgi:hypothetical protein
LKESAKTNNKQNEIDEETDDGEEIDYLSKIKPGPKSRKKIKAAGSKPKHDLIEDDQEEESRHKNKLRRKLNTKNIKNKILIGNQGPMASFQIDKTEKNKPKRKRNANKKKKNHENKIDMFSSNSSSDSSSSNEDDKNVRITNLDDKEARKELFEVSENESEQSENKTTKERNATSDSANDMEDENELDLFDDDEEMEEIV